MSNGQSQWRTITGAGSYLSHSDMRAHFGLATAQKVDQIDIVWPNGTMTTLRDLPANRHIEIDQSGDYNILPSPSALNQ